MKHCNTCGLDNPDEARFCMKCGKDLEAIQVSDIPPEILEPDTFTPSGSHDGPIGVSPVRRDDEQLGDKEIYKKAASEAAFSDAVVPPVHPGEDEPAEIQLTDVTADFTERRKFCDKCGAANPHEQAHCRNCGTPLDAGKGAYDRKGPGVIERPLAREAVEPTLLTDMTPTSDYYAESTYDDGYHEERYYYGGRFADWGVQEWLILIGATVFLSLIIWFLAFGGFRIFFDTKAKNVNKAGQAMVDLGSFEYSILASLESVQTGSYSGRGKADFQSPDRTIWELVLNTPIRGQVVLQSIQVGETPYFNAPTGWVQSNPKEFDVDLRSLWSDVSNIEDLGNETVGSINCYHYKYNVPSLMITSALGAGPQTGAIDSLVEAWIDTTNFHIIKMTVHVYNIQYEGSRTRVKLDMNLAATGQPYDIKPPI